MDQARALLELQDVDLDLLRSAKRLEDLPERVAILQCRAKTREIEALREKADLLVHKLNAELRAIQDEVTMLGEKIATEQTKLGQTTDHRMAQSITREMDGLNRRRDKREIDSLAVMERIEKAVAQVGKVDEALAQLAAKENELVTRFQKVGGALQTEIAALEAHRAEVAGGLDADLLARYESVRATKGGIGVGKLDGDTCTACRMTLPSQRVAAMLASTDIVDVCPQCRRLLVVHVTEVAE